eukprot:gene11258-10207_t
MDPALHVAQEQVEILRQIRAYLGQELNVFAILPITLLFSSVCVEIVRALEFGTAWWRLPRAPAAQPAERAGTGGAAIHHASPARRAAAVFIALARASIAVWLAATGVFAIASSLVAEQQMLTPVGLVFVLDIDELAFRAFAPAPVPAVIAGTRLRTAPPTRRAGRARTPVVVAAIAAALVATQSRLVRPLHRSLLAAEDALCGGDRGFTMSRYPGTRVPVFAPSTTYAVGQRVGSPYADAVAQRLHRSSDSSRPPYSVRPATPVERLQREHRAESFEYTRPEASRLEAQRMREMTRAPCWDGVWGELYEQLQQPLAFLKAIRRTAKNRSLCGDFDRWVAHMNSGGRNINLWHMQRKATACCEEAAWLCRDANSSVLRS